MGKGYAEGGFEYCRAQAWGGRPIPDLFFDLFSKFPRKSNRKLGELIGDPIKYIDLYKTYLNGWEMVGEYPTFVLRSGGIPGRGLFFFLSKVSFVCKKCMFVCFYDKTSLFIIKRPDAGLIQSAPAAG